MPYCPVSGHTYTKEKQRQMETTEFNTPPCSARANEMVDKLWGLAEAILPEQAMRFEGGDNDFPTDDREAFAALLLGLASVLNISGLCDSQKHNGPVNVRSRIGCLSPALRHFGWEAK